MTNPPEIKRKRGRPRKHPLPVDNTVVDENVHRYEHIKKELTSKASFDKVWWVYERKNDKLELYTFTLLEHSLELLKKELARVCAGRKFEIVEKPIDTLIKR